MNFSLFIARRYLFAKKSTNAVNLITAISAVSVMIAAAAMIIVLSAFNGLESLVKSFYDTFDPDLKIQAVEGKSFLSADISDAIFLDNSDISSHSRILEEKALLRFREREFIAVLKGVDSNYIHTTGISAGISHGQWLPDYVHPTAVVGQGVAIYLSLGSLRLAETIQAYVPKTGSFNELDPMNSLSIEHLNPVGVFSVQPEFDSKYVLVPLPVAAHLFDREGQLTSIEVKVKEGRVNQVQKYLQSKLGEGFSVLTRDEQQVAIFKVLRSEGMITFLILAFILIIASFGIIGSNILLIIEKQGDIKTLRSMGASLRMVKRIFLVEGLLISLGGAFIGLLLGIAIVVLQDQFGLVGLGDGYAVQAYPVELRWTDFLLIGTTVTAVGAMVSAVSVRRISAD